MVRGVVMRHWPNWRSKIKARAVSWVLGWIGYTRDTVLPASTLIVKTAHAGFGGPVEAIVPARQLVRALFSDRTWPQRTPQRHHPWTLLVGAAFLDLSSAV